MSTGTPLGNMMIRLNLDDADFGKGVDNSRKRIRYLSKEMQANARAAQLAGDRMGQLTARSKGLSSMIKAQEEQVRALNEAYEGSLVDGKLTDSSKRIAAELMDAQAKLAAYKKQLIDTAGAMAELQVKTEGWTGKLYKSSEKLISVGDKMSSVGSSLTRGLTVPLTGAVTAATTAAIKWESAFAGVKKTNDEVVDANGRVIYSYRDLEQGLRNLAKELPPSHQEIASVAEAAGQLGIQSQNVVKFTKTMIDLGESTNMSAEQAATTLARFANITQMSQNDFDRLGSTIVALGNNFATTESEISDMALRLAGAGNQIGMTNGEILGLATALSSVGIEAQAGGSAFSKVMVQMQLATEKGGKSLNNFARVAGMTSQKFSEMFKSNPTEALLSFVEGLAHAEERGTSAIKVLDDMGITEVRLRDSLLRAANASGVFSDAVRTGNKAWEENTALTEEASKRYETTEAKLKMLKNEAVDAAIELGGPFVDALREGLNSAKPLIKNLGDLARKFSEADPKTQRMIMKMIAFGVAVGPVLNVTGKLTSGIGTLGKGFAELTAQFAKKRAMDAMAKSLIGGVVPAQQLAGALGQSAAGAVQLGSAAGAASGAGGIGAMTTALGGLSGVLLPIAAAIGVGGAIYLGWKMFGEQLYESSQRVKRWGTDVGEETDKVLTKIQDTTLQGQGAISAMSQGVKTDTGAMADSFVQVGNSIEDNITKRIKGMQKALDNLPDFVNESTKRSIEKQKSQLEQSLNVIKENTQKISEIRKNAMANDRQVTQEELGRINNLYKSSAEEYVNTLSVSQKERKRILTAMTGDVRNASKEQATEWVKSLGKQRESMLTEWTKTRESMRKELKDNGLSKEMIDQIIKDFDTSKKAMVDGLDSQIKAIVDKYPELAKKFNLLNGKVLDGTEEMRRLQLASNKKLLDNALSLVKDIDGVADMAGKSGRKAAEAWNSIVLDEKTGEVKTNMREAVIDATKDVTKWNEMKLLVHNADLDSNARRVIGEAAIANDYWDGMAWEDKEAILHDKFSVNMYKALSETGKWNELSIEEKQAIVQSNTKEELAGAIFELGLWDELQPEVKELKADNSGTIQKIQSSSEMLERWNGLPEQTKQLIVDNPGLLEKVLESTDTYTTWMNLPNDVKQMLANNEDLKAKVADGTLTVQQYDALQPQVKKLTGDASNVTSASQSGQNALNSYASNNPATKFLQGNPQSVVSASGTGVSALDRFNNNNPATKKLKANDNASGPANDARAAVGAFSDISNVITKTLRVVYEKVTGRKNARGTNYHPGGHAIVNDQKGPVYRELVIPKGGTPFIPEGRDVFLPDLPRGSKVLKAYETRKLFPHYADGIGIPQNAKKVRQLASLSETRNNDTFIQSTDTTHIEKRLDELVRIMQKFGQQLADTEIKLDSYQVGRVLERNRQRTNRLKHREVGEFG
ncbi:phage tail tape measure protein [Atopobacter phocae]|uniref:phage tail tape measure protein n=1 Tax=Atopobacter phocae TaxID=136492 RepID=UPI00046F7FBC|nr:phage tail tape measure protein [Atopobacter phocae]